MIKFHRKFRATYWSSSRLANWIRSVSGLEKPKAMSMEDWDSFDKRSAEKSPIAFWIVDTGFNKLQNIVMFPVDVFYSVKVFYKNWKNNSHVLDGGLPVGQWSDLCYRIPRCLFGELEKFIEVEKGFETLEWEKKLVWDESCGYTPEDECYGQLTDQALAAIESEAIYSWWKANKDRDFYEESGYTAACEERRKEGKSGIFNPLGEQTKEVKEALDRLRVLEEQYAKEEEENLIKLIKLRDSLWS